MKQQIIYASFWQRALALFIDAFILLIPQFIFAKIIAFILVSEPNANRQDYMTYLIIKYSSLVFAWLYFSLFESSSLQATLGKKVMGLCVTNNAGNRLSFAQASGRFFGKIISTIIMGAGFLMAAFTSKKQALHDIMASCIVVKNVLTEIKYVDEEQFYLTAQEELDTNKMLKGIWLKAFESHPKDKILQQAAYLRFRVEQLHSLQVSTQSTVSPPSIKRLILNRFKHWFYINSSMTGGSKIKLRHLVSYSLLAATIAGGIWSYDLLKKAQKRYNKATYNGKYDKSWTILYAKNYSYLHVKYKYGKNVNYRYQTRAEFVRKSRAINPHYEGRDDDYVYQDMINQFPEYQQKIAENYIKFHYNAKTVCYKGSTIHIYDEESDNYYYPKFPEPDQIIEGATEINIYRGGEKHQYR